MWILTHAGSYAAYGIVELGLTLLSIVLADARDCDISVLSKLPGRIANLRVNDISIAVYELDRGVYNG